MANSNDDKILELAGNGNDWTWEYPQIAANCAPDLVRRIAALRAIVRLAIPEIAAGRIRTATQALAEVLETDDALCAAMKVGDE